MAIAQQVTKSKNKKYWKDNKINRNNKIKQVEKKRIIHAIAFITSFYI